MRRLLTLIILASVAWSGYWFFGSQGLNTAFTKWFEARRAEGWAADYIDLQISGFPNRFDTTFTNLALADPGTGLAWEAPFFQVFALSYKPNHVIGIWPNAQLIATPQGKYDLISQKMRASIVFQPDTQLALERTTLTAEMLSVAPSGTNEKTSLDALSLAAERLAPDGATYRLGLSADGLKPPVPWVRAGDPDGTLPDTLQALSADLTITFDKPWNRSAIETARPQPRAIEIKLAEARWGQLELQMAGDLTVDPSGVVKGQIMIKARNWRDILKLAIAAGALPEQLAGPVEDGLGLIAQLAGNPKTLDIPLDFRDGSIHLGPVPVGPAPSLRIR